MEASVHPLPEPDRRRLRGVTDQGELKDWMPQSLPEAYQMIEGLLGKLAQASAADTRLRNEFEAKAVADIQSAAIMEVLVEWRDTCMLAPDRVRLVANGKRWQRVKKRMEDGWTVEELKLVPHGALESDWHTGKNPDGKRYLEVDTIFRDAEQVEKFVNLARHKQDEDFDERLRKWHLEHPSIVYEACVRERQAGRLYELDPTAALPRPSETKDGDA